MVANGLPMGRARFPRQPKRVGAISQEASRRIAVTTKHLPDCMMPDGAEPCKGYRELQEQLSDLEPIFDLRWKADMRAIKQWQEAHPGKEFVWPDHADLVVWLLEQLEKRESTNTHDYLSTACYHGLHERCRKTCKFCDTSCRCLCHQKEVMPNNQRSSPTSETG